MCIRNVRSETLVDRDAVERADRGHDALGVRGVAAGDGHVAHDAPALDAHEVDRAEDRALFADRAGDAREDARVLRQLDAAS